MALMQASHGAPSTCGTVCSESGLTHDGQSTLVLQPLKVLGPSIIYPEQGSRARRCSESTVIAPRCHSDQAACMVSRCCHVSAVWPSIDSHMPNGTMTT